MGHYSVIFGCLALLVCERKEVVRLPSDKHFRISNCSSIIPTDNEPITADSVVAHRRPQPLERHSEKILQRRTRIVPSSGCKLGISGRRCERDAVTIGRGLTLSEGSWIGDSETESLVVIRLIRTPNNSALWVISY